MSRTRHSRTPNKRPEKCICGRPEHVCWLMREINGPYPDEIARRLVRFKEKKYQEVRVNAS